MKLVPVAAIGAPKIAEACATRPGRTLFIIEEASPVSVDMMAFIQSVVDRGMVKTMGSLGFHATEHGH